MRLEELGSKYGTDKRKRRHNYLEVYERLFESKQIEHLLEMGVHRMYSHKLWLEYFPKAHIYGLDIREYNSTDIPSVIARENPMFHLASVDCGDKEELCAWADEQSVQFDVIIDDASHLSSHQIVAYETLWGYVSPGGYYIVEDIHCAYREKWADQEIISTKYFQRLIDEVNQSIHPTIDSITFTRGLIILQKKYKCLL